MINMHDSLREAIARLRETTEKYYDDPISDIAADVALVCDALEANLKPAPKFDKVAYQREYMRKWRKAKA